MRRIQIAMVTGCLHILACACLVGLAAGGASAAERCPNESFRTGRSASLPDCRGYELVTPEHLGRTQDMVFENDVDSGFVSIDGDGFALRAFGAFLEPATSISGTRAVFVRTSKGWEMTPVTTPAMEGEEVVLQLLSPDLSRIAFEAGQALVGTGGTFEQGSRTFEAGPIGGPYSTLATVPPSYSRKTQLVGANAGVPGNTPPFSAVVLSSADHVLLPPGPEREAAERTEAEHADLYEWSGEQLRLVNISGNGQAIGPCGATLGSSKVVGNAVNAVSADGSKVFFRSPEGPHMSGCLEPGLYMRVDGRETVDVSEPEGVSVAPVDRGDVLYDGASADGSRVFFTTVTALTPSAESRPGYKLYEYDTEASAEHRLTLIGNEVATVERQFVNPGVVVSEDGSAVYYEGECGFEEHGQHFGVAGICRYETATGETSFVAVPQETVFADEPWSVTPGGDFFLFASGSPANPLPVEFQGPDGLERELRGAGGHEELYRYDAADGVVTCVSCGEGIAPGRGFLREPESNISTFAFPDIPQGALSISEDGRRVFFQTTAKLVPQDTNKSSEVEEEKGELGAGTDVYEWEQDGTEEAPGLFCQVANGCTHLISAGEAVGPERFLGSSANGDDVFFTSAAQLLPQATPEFTNIYDARVDGGFSPPQPSVECAICQGVGSPARQFGTPASVTLAGAGNPPASTRPPGPTGTNRKRCKRGYTRNRRSRCVRAKTRRKRRL
jgi:hypothetical protein